MSKKRQKAKVDWSLSGCCGAKRQRIAGLWRCSSCGREVRGGPHWDRGNEVWDDEPPLSMAEQHRRRFERGEEE